MAFKELNPLLHSPLRLAIISLLIGVKEADFKYIKDATEATAGNLSVQITKLKEAGYIEVEKKFQNNYPLTICKITKQGLNSFESYVQAIQGYIAPETEQTNEADETSFSPI
jgi:DNA-binding transcriptional ArsR family regulator